MSSNVSFTTSAKVPASSVSSDTSMASSSCGGTSSFTSVPSSRRWKLASDTSYATTVPSLNSVNLDFSLGLSSWQPSSTFAPLRFNPEVFSTAPAPLAAAPQSFTQPPLFTSSFSINNNQSPFAAHCSNNYQPTTLLREQSVSALRFDSLRINLGRSK